MRRLILPLFLVLSSSGCGGCVGDDSPSSKGKPNENSGGIHPAIVHTPLRPIVPALMPNASAAPPASAAPAAPSAPPPAPSGSAVP
ncbi:MAG TPA: hypothetical protein VMI75_37695 [Polyangiaceae bacterium]|nr:hypothetical protein [Polyangiaceae bacterium]